MACNGKACAECTQNCLLIHGKKRDPSPVVTSFFKIMIGENFSKVLYLPPKFAKTMSAMVDQRTYLEDSTGQRWKVKLSNHDGALAILEGWPAFSMDHFLGVGDFLVFYYITGSHFVVHIWGKSGCEKFDCRKENNNPKKKTRTDGNLSGQDGRCRTNDKRPMKGQCSSESVVSGWGNELQQVQPVATKNNVDRNGGSGRPQRVSAFECQEVPFYMMDRDAGYEQEADRAFLYDLSGFEMHGCRAGADGKLLNGYERSLGTGTIVKSLAKSRFVSKGLEDVKIMEEGLGDAGLVDVEIMVAPSDKANYPKIKKANVHEMSEFCCSLVPISMHKSDSGKISNVIEQKNQVKNKEAPGCREPLPGMKCGQNPSFFEADEKVYLPVKIEPANSFDSLE